MDPYSQENCSYAPLACELDGLRFCRQVIGFSRLTSTNAFALAPPGGDLPPGTLVLADGQTEGRGRLQRAWDSPTGHGIYATLTLPPALLGPAGRLAPLAAGLAVQRAVAPLLGEAAAGLDLKWPNDLLWNGRKLAGVLAEAASRGATPLAAVIGIGVNVGQESFPPELSGRAISLRQVTGRAISRHDLLLRLLGELDGLLALLADGRGDELRRAWEAGSTFARGRKVKFFRDGQAILGTTAGLMADGALCIRTLQAGEVAVHGGEVFEY